MKARIVTTLALGLLASSVCADPNWKIRMDPLMALANFPNIEIDRAVSPTMSVGAMAWYHDNDWFSSSNATSVGVRVDWFEQGVFADGWHTNLVLKSDWTDGEWDRARLKGTQTYQWAWGSFFFNAGIGAQLVSDGRVGGQTQVYDEYQPWLLPAWEISFGRSF